MIHEKIEIQLKDSEFKANLFTYFLDNSPEIDLGRKRPVVLICPGGGYTYLAMGYEGEEFAQWLVKQGITGIVLKYRMPNQHDRIPMTDALRAMKWIRSRSEEWGIDPAKVGTTDRLEQYSSRPDFQILFYPVISMTAGLTHRGSREALLGKNPSAEAIAQYSNEQHVTAKTPPALLFHSDDDTVVPSMNSVVFYQALKKNKVPAVLYIFDKGGHGWGMRNNFEYHNQWTNLLANWLKKI